MNDLPSSVTSSHLLLFADDTKCLKQIDDTEDCAALQQDLQQLSSWSNSWSLHFNESKCVVLRYSTGSSCLDSEHTYCINGHPIVTHECYQDLGALMSKDLCWRRHYDYLLSKILGLLQRTFAKVGYPYSKKALFGEITTHLLLPYLAPSFFERH